VLLWSSDLQNKGIGYTDSEDVTFTVIVLTMYSRLLLM